MTIVSIMGPVLLVVASLAGLWAFIARGSAPTWARSAGHAMSVVLAAVAVVVAICDDAKSGISFLGRGWLLLAVFSWSSYGWSRRLPYLRDGYFSRLDDQTRKKLEKAFGLTKKPSGNNESDDFTT